MSMLSMSRRSDPGRKPFGFQTDPLTQSSSSLRSAAVALLSLALTSSIAGAGTSSHLLGHTGQVEQTTPVTADDLQYLAQKGDRASQLRLREIFPRVPNTSARCRAVTTLATWHGLQATDTLVALYGSVDDVQVKQTILTQLFVLGDSKDMKLLLASEKDAKLHGIILSRLSLMSN